MSQHEQLALVRQTLSGPPKVHVDKLHSVARNLSFEAATPAPPQVYSDASEESKGPLVVSSEAKQESENDRSSTAPPASTLEEETPSMRVVLRVRPLSEQELRDGVESCISRTQKTPNAVAFRPQNLKCLPPLARSYGKTMFRFSHIFDETSGQSEVFEQTTLPMIDGLFHGHSAVVFAYGVTCSGKTWTIQGSPQHPGVLPRTLDVIVNSIAVAKGHGLLQESFVSENVAALTTGRNNTSRRARARDKQYAGQKMHDANYLEVSSTVDYKIFASYLEIYNEQCFDLFDRFSPSGVLDEYSQGSQSARGEGSNSAVKPEPSEYRKRPRQKRPVLKLREGEGGEVYADGLTEVEIRNGADIDCLLEFGQNNRSVAQTSANVGSSRSHAVFFITLKQTQTIKQPKGRPKVATKRSRLCIVDLAGSERTSRTNNTGLRLREANQINSSLMSLGRCLKFMRDNEQLRKSNPAKKPFIVPYRESRLTRLLQHSLETGSAVMIANASPAMYDADETVQALRCAQIAREVFAASSKRRAPIPNRPNILQPLDPNVSLPRSKQLKSKKTNLEGVATPSTRTRLHSSRQKNGTPGIQKENRHHLLKIEVERLKKENAFLLMERDEERCARLEAEKFRTELENEHLHEVDVLFRQNEKLKDCLADAEARVILAEREIREEVVDEAQQIIQQLQENYQRQLDEAHASRSTKSARVSVFCEREQRENAERMAERMAMRVSRAAFDDIKMRLADDVRLSTQSCDTLDTLNEDDYIEED